MLILESVEARGGGFLHPSGGDKRAMQTRSDRLKALPPYLFAKIDRKKKAAIAAGRPVINLGIGDPDRPTPDFIIEAAQPPDWT